MFSRLLRLLRKHRIWLLLIVCTSVFGITLYNVVRPPPEDILDLSPPKFPSNPPSSALLGRADETVTTATPEHHDVTTSVHLTTKDEERGRAATKPFKMVVGILSALRKPPTILNVATQLVQSIDRSSYTLLVWQAFSASSDHQTKHWLEDLGYTVFTQPELYPELGEGRLQITLGDTKERMLWRAGHVLDYANLLERSLQYSAEYVVILEDDMLPAHRALDKVYESLKSLGTPDRLGYMAFFSVAPFRSRGMERINGNLGYEGACVLAYPAGVVARLVQHLRANVYAQPVDLIIASFMEKVLRVDVYERVPHLFQHNSKRSSYAASDQAKRDTEHLRSIFFVYDEANSSLLYRPSQSDGYLGCHADSSSFSDLSGKFKTLGSTGNLVADCRGVCTSYLYFGLQRDGEGQVVCYCGNEFGFHGSAPDDDCGSCGSYGRCGKVMRNAVYRTEPFAASLVGCYRDAVQSRDLEISLKGGHTPFSCALQCSKHRYFAIQFGGECFCGDAYGRHGKLEESQCAMPCVRDMRLPCGGALANLIFQTTK
ncbi:hypothetical protein EMCRGX_G010178 [Ephydatia muelleri]